MWHFLKWKQLDICKIIIYILKCVGMFSVHFCCSINTYNRVLQKYYFYNENQIL